MSRVIILSDLTNAGIHTSRYIGPYVIANHLESEGFDTVVIDFFTKHTDFFEYIKDFLTLDTIAVCISSTFLTPKPSVESSNRMLRARNYYSSTSLWLTDEESLNSWLSNLKTLMGLYAPKAKLILGGNKADLAYKMKTLSNSYSWIDYAVVGLADLTAVSLIKDIERNGYTASNTDSLLMKKNGLNFVFPRQQYNECPEFSYKKHWGIMHGEGLPIEISRGCLYNCKFCHYDKKQSIRKPVDKLRDEFVRNYEEFGVTSYHFCDDCFNDTKPKVMEVCETILSLPFKINWISYARVDLAVKFPETLDIMIESGARGLGFGIETFNHKAAKAAGKGVPSEKIKQMLLDNRKKYKDDCLFIATFIVGLPHETEESQMETIEWLVNNDALDHASFSSLNIHEFDEETDQVIEDFPDFSRNPEKYGFLEIKFNPVYWRHATMDKPIADKLTAEVSKRWNGKKQGYLHNFWSIPAMFSLGYDWQEIREMYRSPDIDNRWMHEIKRRRSKWLNDYWDRLQKFN